MADLVLEAEAVSFSRLRGSGLAATYQIWMAFFQSKPSMHPPLTETTFLPFGRKHQVNKARQLGQEVCLRELCGLTGCHIACRSNYRPAQVKKKKSTHSTISPLASPTSTVYAPRKSVFYSSRLIRCYAKPDVQARKTHL